MNVSTDAILLEVGKLHMGLTLAQAENARLQAELAKARALVEKLSARPPTADGEEVYHGR